MTVVDVLAALWAGIVVYAGLMTVCPVPVSEDDSNSRHGYGVIAGIAAAAFTVTVL